MSTETFNGCSYSDLWVNPKNWKTITSKKSFEKTWYVQCKFYDPNFKEKYPKGFPYRKKVNSFKDLEERKIAVQELLDEIPKLFTISGYNPIPEVRRFMVELKTKEPDIDSISEQTPFIEAMEFAYKKMTLSDSSMEEIGYVIEHISIAAAQLEVDHLPINEIGRRHFKLIIDHLESTKGKFSNHKFNRYRGCMRQIYNELDEYEVVPENIAAGIRKKPVERKIRETLTKHERFLVSQSLKRDYPNFWLFMVLYFHSGGRILEMLRLKVEDVDLENQVYKSLIKKRKQYTWVNRPIKQIAIKYWKEVLKLGKKDDYVFSVGLVPGPKMIRREQISRRWFVHVKTKMGITADFASLKHSNLDEITEILSAKDAAAAAGHTNEKMVLMHYAVGEEGRKLNRVKNISNEFA